MVGGCTRSNGLVLLLSDVESGRWEVGGRKWEVGVMRGEGVVTHS